MMYAAEIIDGAVVQVIVGNATWAVEHLGGVWIDSPEKIGIGWLWDGTTFTPAPTPTTSEQ